MLIWQRGVDLVAEVYKMTRDFPREELYGLSVQMRRSAVSVPSNIAEGFVRKKEKDFKRFLNMALASLAELETQLVVATPCFRKDVAFRKNNLGGEK